jgi:hypothetical protein
MRLELEVNLSAQIVDVIFAYIVKEHDGHASGTNVLQHMLGYLRYHHLDPDAREELADLIEDYRRRLREGGSKRSWGVPAPEPNHCAQFCAHPAYKSIFSGSRNAGPSASAL